MTNFVVPRFHRRLPVLGGVCCSSSPRTHLVTTSVVVVGSSSYATRPHALSRALLKKWNKGVKAPRRMVLGLGASFLAQFMGMAGAVVGSKSFIASARIKGGPSVDEVIYQFFM